MRQLAVAVAAISVVLVVSTSVFAQSSTEQTSTVSTARLINVSGVFRPADGAKPNPVETVTVAIYAEAAGGAPLWEETQTTPIDPSGRYTVLLGTTERDGVPLPLFAAGEARWMGITFSRAGEAESARTPLTSVPYALKASDAETLGGLPLSAFQLAPAARQAGATQLAASPTDVVSNLVNSGTTNSLAKYVNGVDLGSSAIFETGGRLGINTTVPLDNIHSRFLNTDGGLTGLAVQNLGNSATSYSGMLFYDQNGNTAQFQGFNNSTHEYRINNIARDYFGTGAYNGAINFMLGGSSRLLINPVIGIGMYAPVGILAGAAPIGLYVNSAGDSGISVETTSPTGAGIFADGPQYGVFASTNTGIGVLGYADNVTLGWAGMFDGDVNVLGVTARVPARLESTIRSILRTSTCLTPSLSHRT